MFTTTWTMLIMCLLSWTFDSIQMSECPLYFLSKSLALCSLGWELFHIPLAKLCPPAWYYFATSNMWSWPLLHMKKSISFRCWNSCHLWPDIFRWAPCKRMCFWLILSLHADRPHKIERLSIASCPDWEWHLKNGLEVHIWELTWKKCY